MNKITIRRTSKTPVHEQLVEQLRYLIASGHYQIDQPLPSTRVLAKQLSISFHTVRPTPFTNIFSASETRSHWSPGAHAELVS